MTSVDSESVSDVQRGSIDFYEIGREYGIYAILVVILIAATIVYHGFFTWQNISALLAQNAALGVVAVGETFVIVAGGFDLSVGAVYAMAGTFSAMIAVHGSTWLGYLVGILCGLAAGAINAYVVTGLKVNPFVATLGSSTVFTGLVLIISNSNPITVDDPSYGILGQRSVGQVPLDVIVFIVVVALAALTLRKGTFGRKIFAVGGNVEASRLAGIRTAWVQGGAYVIGGALAALAGLINASQLQVGQGTSGVNIPLDAIAVVVVGGTSLLGGEGSVLRTVVGLLILSTLDNIFFSLSVSSNWQQISQGLILIAAVAVDQVLRRARRR